MICDIISSYLHKTLVNISVSLPSLIEKLSMVSYIATCKFTKYRKNLSKAIQNEFYNLIFMWMIDSEEWQFIK